MEIEPRRGVAQSEEDYRAALSLALSSATLSRSDQLRHFLKFVCEMEITGRGDEINEYMIGTEVLRRPDDYRPYEDSSVRNRAHSLRRKLAELYATELVDAPVRIELPKGSYRPKFVPAELAEEGPSAALADSAPPYAEPTSSRPSGLMVMLFVGGFGLGLLPWLWQRSAEVPAKPLAAGAELKEVWGPLVDPDANVLICIGSPFHVLVRPALEGPKPTAMSNAELLDPLQNKGLYSAYSARYPLAPGRLLQAQPTDSSPLWGDSIGALLISRQLAALGVPHEVMPERVGSLSMLRDRNVVLFARGDYSQIARDLLRDMNFDIGFSEVGELVIVNRKPRVGEVPVYAPRRYTEASTVEVFALISVFPSEGAKSDRRTVVFSGLTSAGIQAAAEYFSSTSALADFRRRLKAAGYGSIPSAYQILVKTSSALTVPRVARYETHRVFEGRKP